MRYPVAGRNEGIMCSGRPSLHYAAPGYITLTEVAALQSFPSTYQFIGDNKAGGRQVGKAVSVRMAVGRSIQAILCCECEVHKRSGRPSTRLCLFCNVRDDCGSLPFNLFVVRIVVLLL
jgi:hypothetical protein